MGEEKLRTTSKTCSLRLGEVVDQHNAERHGRHDDVHCRRWPTSPMAASSSPKRHGQGLLAVVQPADQRAQNEGAPDAQRHGRPPSLHGQPHRFVGDGPAARRSACPPRWCRSRKGVMAQRVVQRHHGDERRRQRARPARYFPHARQSSKAGSRGRRRWRPEPRRWPGIRRTGGSCRKAARRWRRPQEERRPGLRRGGCRRTGGRTSGRSPPSVRRR